MIVLTVMDFNMLYIRAVTSTVWWGTVPSLLQIDRWLIIVLRNSLSIVIVLFLHMPPTSNEYEFVRSEIIEWMSPSAQLSSAVAMIRFPWHSVDLPMSLIWGTQMGQFKHSEKRRVLQISKNEKAIALQNNQLRWHRCLGMERLSGNVIDIDIIKYLYLRWRSWWANLTWVEFVWSSYVSPLSCTQYVQPLINLYTTNPVQLTNNLHDVIPFFMSVGPVSWAICIAYRRLQAMVS